MSQYAHPEVLVDTQWLMDHLEDPMVHVVEVDMSPESHKDNHIPGAIFWNFSTDLSMPDFRMNLDPTAMEKLLSRSGISQETTVIAYGSYPGTGAFIFWFLKLFGHQKVYVLNGGHQKWVAEGRPVTSDFSNFPPTSYQATSPNPDLRVLQSEVQASLERTDCVVLDVRTPQEYSGEIFMMKPPEGSERGGHIPGAVHIENTHTLNDDGTFKSVEELHALYSSRGVIPNPLETDTLFSTKNYVYQAFFNKVRVPLQPDLVLQRIKRYFLTAPLVDALHPLGLF